ncbi:hypothetical protein M0R72_12540 [Candidatus Pacearchaeota archaeon]|jgi:hypothetical protein|nr:hypothetical protein [Candidatus Pacearchaeota archaeon]
MAFDERGAPEFTTQDADGRTVKWWHERILTGWAVRDSLDLPKLPDVRGWVVQAGDGTLQYVVTEGQTPIFDTQSLEAAACHIDAMRMIRRA